MPDAYSQPDHLEFKYLTPDDGLSSSIASCIIQDQEGFMWIGTPDGLNRYDGFKFNIYRNDPGDSTSITDNVIRALFEDHNKNLLIGTENGLCLYDRKMDRFLNYVFDNSSPLKGIACTVSEIAEDSTGNLWLATNVGLIYFDRMKNKIVQYSHDINIPGSLSNNNVEAVLSDRNGSVWAATRGGLNLFLPGSGTFKHFNLDENGKSLENTVFIDNVEDHEGNLWFGSTEGLYCLENHSRTKTDILIHYQHDAKDESSLSINLVRSLFVDDAGNLWIGTDNGGINLFNREKHTFWHYRKDEYDSQSLNNEAIESIYQDKSKNLWFGTYTGGLNIAMSNMGAIIKYQNLPGALSSLSHNTVTGFLEDNNGQIWVGTDGGGLNLFESQTGRFTRFNINNSGLSSNAILCITADSNNHVWVGTWAGGLVHFNPDNNSFTFLNTKNSGIQDNSIFAIAEGYNNDLWLGSFENGLIHYQINEKKFTSYNPSNSNAGNQLVLKIVKYSGGRFLIGTAANLQIFNPSDGTFVTYTHNPDNFNSLSYSRITDFLIVNDSCVWVGTPDGLNRFNPITGSFIRYFVKNGLPSSFIKGIVQDDNGVLWITTNMGVSRFDYKQDEFKNFTKADGFQSNEFSERSILRMKSGALLMGGIKGFNLVYPKKITENKRNPNIIITDLKLFNKSISPGTRNSPLIQNITETKSITLAYDQSVLTFSFAGMDFSAPEKNQYAYMMENFDRDWNFSGNKGEATYTNLSPGQYVFRAKGSNNDGFWNETGASIRITVLPPWWGTWWFRLGVLIILTSLLTFLYYYRLHSLNRQKALLEKSVAIKTVELQNLNASKDKFFSIIAHDLKNPFNVIIGYSEILKEELLSGNSSKTNEYVERINYSAVHTLRLLENLLEWANSQRGNIIFNPVILDLNELFHEEYSSLYEMATGKNIELISNLPDKLSLKADKNMIKTVLRNLISNSIKFTYRNGKVEINASLKVREVEISVSDNGIGMSKETMSRLFRIDENLLTLGTENEKGTGLGLLLCKEFIEKHGGKIWVESESGKGSTFRFSLPLEN